MIENEGWVGKKVRAVDKYEAYAPKEGAVGIVTEYDSEDSKMPCSVLWENGYGAVWCFAGSIELIDEDTNMPYADIWKMLEPKMEKNGLVSHSGYVKIEPSDLPGCHHHPVKTYDEDDVQKAVALAYKIGYMRAIKGRPFKYADNKVNVTIDNLDEVEGDECPCAPCWAKPVAKKKVKPMGHWEKVDPKNLPKEGSKVRYARLDGRNHLYPIHFGDTGVFKLGGPFKTSGIVCNKDNEWRSFRKDVNCLDVWIEGEGDAE